MWNTQQKLNVHMLYGYTMTCTGRRFTGIKPVDVIGYVLSRKGVGFGLRGAVTEWDLTLTYIRIYLYICVRSATADAAWS